MQPLFEARGFIGTHNDEWYDEGFHTNYSLEISIVMEGRGMFEWSERKHYVEAGHVIVVSPGVPHRFEAVTKVRFGVIHLANVPARLAELTQRLSGSSGAPGITTLSRLDKERFERLFREWLRLASSPIQELERTHAAWMEVLLLFLLEHLKADLQAMTVTKAADFIRENLRENVHMADLATLAGLSESAFRRLFEQTYRMSPKQYQQQCRMNEAKWLLSATDKDMKEIAEQVGFYRLHSFSQWFKETEGVSPSVWRKRQQMKDDVAAT